MKRFAAPMVGWMMSSTLLTLVVIPAVYALWRERRLGVEEGAADGTPEESLARSSAFLHDEGSTFATEPQRMADGVVMRCGETSSPI